MPPRNHSTAQLIKFSPMTNYEQNNKNIDILISESHKTKQRQICISKGLENYLKKEKLLLNQNNLTNKDSSSDNPKLLKPKIDEKKITFSNLMTSNVNNPQNKEKYKDKDKMKIKDKDLDKDKDK